MKEKRSQIMRGQPRLLSATTRSSAIIPGLRRTEAGFMGHGPKPYPIRMPSLRAADAGLWEHPLPFELESPISTQSQIERFAAIEPFETEDEVGRLVVESLRSPFPSLKQALHKQSVSLRMLGFQVAKECKTRLALIEDGNLPESLWCCYVRSSGTSDRHCKLVDKQWATTRYLSALGTAVAAHLGTIVRGPRDAGSLPDGHSVLYYASVLF